MKLSVIVNILAILTLGSCAPSISCPSAHDIFPCTCKRLAYGLHVLCANFTDNQALIKALKVLRDFEIQKVLLQNLSLPGVLPKDLFDGLEINELQIGQSNLRFSQPAFKGLDESLNILNVMQQSQIKSAQGFLLAKLTKLTKLQIRSNMLKKVTNDLLNGKVPSVTSIVLEEDEINEVQDKAFSTLKELESISLADNRLKKVSRSMFPRPATKLLKIDLNGNEIKDIPFDFFEEMPNLREIILSGNDLTTLPEMTWISIWERLDRVLLQENRLVCDEKLNWLRNTRWPKEVEGNCFSPAEYDGKSLKSVYGT